MDWTSLCTWYVIFALFTHIFYISKTDKILPFFSQFSSKFLQHFWGNRFTCMRVPTVLEKSLNFGFSLKSPLKWICPWKVLQFRVPSLKFQLVVLDFLFCVFWTESLNGYSKLRGIRNNFPQKILPRFARSSLQVKYFSGCSCSILKQLLYPSFPKNTYRCLCILCVSMYQSVSKWAVSTLIVK